MPFSILSLGSGERTCFLEDGVRDLSRLPSKIVCSGSAILFFLLEFCNLSDIGLLFLNLILNSNKNSFQLSSTLKTNHMRKFDPIEKHSVVYTCPRAESLIIYDLDKLALSRIDKILFKTCLFCFKPVFMFLMPLIRLITSINNLQILEKFIEHYC